MFFLYIMIICKVKFYIFILSRDTKFKIVADRPSQPADS